MITRDLRCAIGQALAAAGLEPADPGLRPTGIPGQYASSVAFALGEPPAQVAAHIAALLARSPFAESPFAESPFAGSHPAAAPLISRVEVTGPGFISITVTKEALAALPERIVAAGPACATSDALRGLTVHEPPPADPLTAPGWEESRKALAAQLTARLAAAAGATVPPHQNHERSRDSVVPAQPSPFPDNPRGAPAVAFAGSDAVRFSLARAIPGRPVLIDPLTIARHVPDNPAYAVRYAHARAASAVRWAATSRETVTTGGSPLRAILVDVLSWLPERVAAAARRGRPDEFARYLEELAGATIAALICAGDPGSARAPGTDRLGVAGAARTGLAAGLGLLGVSAPDRI